MIAVEELTKRFEGRSVLDALSVRFERGKVTAVCGPSGCGKATLLRCLVGLERFDAGIVRVGDLALDPRGAREAASAIRLRVGLVFQHYGLFAHMSVLRNVIEAPVHVRGLPAKEATERAKALLDRVGLSHRRDAFPRELSGGEQQRVAIARALAMEPEALLLDEPTSALDPERKAEVLRVLEGIAREGTTLVNVPHEPNLVRGIADRAIMLREGRVAAEGPPGEVLG
jgi:polar amino acid transport system ATP-binding protein